MKQLKNIKILVLACLISMSAYAQELTKVSQSIKVNDDVTIDLNTSYCNIEIDTWKRDIVEIEAYVEGEKLSKEELQKVLKSWDVDIDASSDYISISTSKGFGNSWDFRFNIEDNEAALAAINELKFELADLSEMDFQFIELPEMPEMPEINFQLPELPVLPEGINKIHFDYEAYKKDGEKYLEQFAENIEGQFGDDYQKKMEAWGEKFGKEWGEKYGKKMEEWGKQFEDKYGEEYQEKMEKWGEEYGKRMEEKAKLIEERAKIAEKRQGLFEERAKKNAENHQRLFEERAKHAEERKQLADKRRAEIEELIKTSSSTKVKKTIKIKMPKDAKLKVNVKHGELKFASIDNLKADLTHTKLVANSINGSHTSINASYAPVIITNWNLGELNLNYVKDAQLVNVDRLVLSSNSSNIHIDNLMKSSIIDGSFGSFKIDKIDKSFSNVNLILQNCDAIIKLPESLYNVQYKGNSTILKHPENNSKQLLKSYTKGNLDSNKTLVINAKFSDIVLH